MKDKEIANDVLSMVKSSLTTYSKAIAESDNQQLRQTLSQIRNSDEQFQYELAQLSSQKGYYQSAGQASQQDIQQTRTQLQPRE